MTKIMTNKEIQKISKTLRLLYVEDDTLVRNTTLELLENYFSDITVAVDGLDGLDKFRQSSFDLILSDINMPNLSGIDMLRKIRDEDSRVAVVFLSAHNEGSYLSTSIQLNVSGYLLKPITLNEFSQELSKICENISLQRVNDDYKLNLEKEVTKKTKELAHKLHHDELTGLYNRYSFIEDIQAIETPIVFIVDINKFKYINEIYGTATGSIVLKEFASFLLDFTHDTTYMVYRLSGDEFIIRDTTEFVDIQKYEDDIPSFFKKLKRFTIDVGIDTLSIDATVGISTSQKDAFECAKLALEHAKEYNKPYEIYSKNIDTRSDAQDAMEWKEKTKLAIEEDRIVSVYQPIVDKTTKIVKYETLMRLKDKESSKLISPFYFLDIAIKTGLYNALSTHIIFEALHVLDTSLHVLSCNFTYGDITNKTFLNELESFFKLSPDLGKRVVFEITESENIADYSVVKTFIQRFRVYDIQVAIDDFGSGFSNFEYILEIEPDYLKIDGSLIKNIDTDKKSYILVKAIVQFSHELGIKVIAEYVHSKTIFEMLKELDVDEYQGFYFSEPLEII